LNYHCCSSKLSLGIFEGDLCFLGNALRLEEVHASSHSEIGSIDCLCNWKFHLCTYYERWLDFNLRLSWHRMFDNYCLLKSFVWSTFDLNMRNYSFLWFHFLQHFQLNHLDHSLICCSSQHSNQNINLDSHFNFKHKIVNLKFADS
jgi:uncharacterized protein Usg